MLRLVVWATAAASAACSSPETLMQLRRAQTERLGRWRMTGNGGKNHSTVGDAADRRRGTGGRGGVVRGKVTETATPWSRKKHGAIVTAPTKRGDITHGINTAPTGQRHHR